MRKLQHHVVDLLGGNIAGESTKFISDIQAAGGAMEDSFASNLKQTNLELLESALFSSEQWQGTVQLLVLVRSCKISARPLPFVLGYTSHSPYTIIFHGTSRCRIA